MKFIARGTRAVPRWMGFAAGFGLLAAGGALTMGACSSATKPSQATATTRQAVATANGLGQNGLSTNGLWSNGLWTNGLWTNGLWTNGLWTNGLWTNGLWTNGLWTNGLWTNGLWTNGLWTNGLWQNGLWQNGLWSNGLWQNGLSTSSGIAQTGSPAYELQSSPYLRELLQYIYACAMPAAVYPPDGGAPTSNYDTTLDPNNGTLQCSESDAGADDGGGEPETADGGGACDTGYSCVNGLCVVPLTGAIGLGINADGSTWWGQPPPGGAADGGEDASGGDGNAGNCDETCQRWVSACVLARTNAYGVHVKISMRASVNAPPAIQAALATSPDEVADYTLREGAYYGNIFATTPETCTTTDAGAGGGAGASAASVQCVAATPPPASPDAGSTPATGPIVQTPTFNACAGPDSNIPEITKRFCSSQGDQVVINVPGACVPPPADAGDETQIGVCDGMDNPTTGAIYGCYGSPDPTQPSCSSAVPCPAGYVCSSPSQGTCVLQCTSSSQCSAGYVCSPQGTCLQHYDEVVTIYLQQPLAVCGNEVCEPPTENTTTCPTDCLSGAWAQDITPNIEQNLVDQTYSSVNSIAAGMSAVGPDNTIAVAGTAPNDINLGGGTLPASEGIGVLAKYAPDGGYDWGVRLGAGAADAGLCSSLFNLSNTPIVAGPTYFVDPPTMTGGTIVPGTYVMTGNPLYIAADAGFGASQVPIQEILQIGPTTDVFDWINYEAPDGGPVPETAEGSDYTVSGNTISFTNTCGGTGSFTEQYTASPNSLSLSYTYPPPFVSTGLSIFTLQEDAGASSGAPQLEGINGVAVAPSGPTAGDITVVGSALDSNDTIYLWLSTYTPGGVLVGTSTLPLANGSSSALQLTRALGVDSQGNVVVAGAFSGPATFGAFTINSFGPQGTFVAKIAPPGADAGADAASEGGAVAAPVAASVVWVQSFTQNIGTFPLSLALDSAGNVLVVDSETYNNDTNATDVYVRKLSSIDGSQIWQQELGTDVNSSGSVYSAVAVDAYDNVYATGVLGSGQSFGGGSPITVNGYPPFLVKYDPNGNFQWVTYANTVCPAAPANCSALPVFGPLQVQGVSIGFDPAGNAVLGSFGDPAVGGGIDFGLGPFSTYGAGNIFVSAYEPSAGQVQWAKQIPTILASQLLGMAVDTQGRVIVSGNYSGSMEVSDDLLVTPVAQDPTVVDSFLASFPEPASSTPPIVGVATSAASPGVSFDTLPNNILEQATSPAGAVVFFNLPTAIDNGNANGSAPGVNVVCSPPPNTTFPLGVTTDTCTASDPAGDSSSATFTVTVIDTIGPAVSGVANITVPATGTSGATVSYTVPAAIDQIYGPVSATCTPAPGSFPIGTTTVTCSATDPAGNTGSTSFTVTVTDTPPAVTVPANITTAATGPSGAVVTFSATATDLVDGTDPVTCAPASGSAFPVGTTTVTCSATDKAGYTGTANFTVTVTDTTKPVVTVPADLTVVATGTKGAVVTFSATATDLVDGTDPVTCTPASGSTFPVGTTTVTCTATDEHGNTGTASFTVTVTESTGPVLTVPADITVAATGSKGAVVTFSATATDPAGGTDPVTCKPASGSTFAIGTTTVTCSATDKAKVTSTASFTVTVTDTTKPVVTVPANITVAATGPKGAVVTFSATATDVVDGTDPVTCTPASGSTFPIGTTTVTCTATDKHGNTGTASFTVTVTDKTLPVLKLPATIIAFATSLKGAVVTYTVSATDVVDGTDPVTCSPASGSTFPLGETTVTCSATDSHGNKATGTFVVWVQFDCNPFLKPLSPTAVSSFPPNTTIPVTFQLIGPSAGITNAAATLSVAKASSTAATTAAATAASTPAVSAAFGFSAAATQYVVNLATTSLSAGTWQLSINLGDGVSRTTTITIQ